MNYETEIARHSDCRRQVFIKMIEERDVQRKQFLLDTYIECIKTVDKLIADWLHKSK